MSLQPQATYPIPEETQRVARAVFPRGNLYMQVADRLGTLYHDMQFRRSSRRVANPPKRPRVWHWLRSSNLPRPLRSPSRGCRP